MSTISVIIPTYNGARHLEKTLDSIFSQTCRPTEVIVVDDCSTDNSFEIASKHQVVTTKIRCLENAGVCAARNIGLRAATGDLISFSDQDDVWATNKIEAQQRTMSLYPEIDYLFTNFVYLSGDEFGTTEKFGEAPADWWRQATQPNEHGVLVFQRSSLPWLLQFQPAFPSTIMIRRSLIDRVGPFDASLGRERSEDLEFLLRCESEGTIAALPCPLVGIRKHDGNYSGDTTKTTVSQIRILAAMAKLGGRYAGYSDLIYSEASRRTIDAIDGLFAAGNFADCLELIKEFPGVSRPLKQRLKIAIAYLPTSIASALAMLLKR